MIAYLAGDNEGCRDFRLWWYVGGQIAEVSHLTVVRAIASTSRVRVKVVVSLRVQKRQTSRYVDRGTTERVFRMGFFGLPILKVHGPGTECVWVVQRAVTT